MINLDKEELNKIKYRIEKTCSQGINAFSPTISPAPKSFDRNEIECIAKGIQFFLDKGESEIIIQKKYMGSYGDIYLMRNIEDSYLVSRNAYLVNRIPKEIMIEKLKAIHERFDWEKEDLFMVLIQCEIMPWRIMGAGLVEQEFLGYLDAQNTHFQHLSSSDLYQKIAAVKQSEDFQLYVKDKAELTEKQMKAKYPSHVARQYDAIHEFIVKDLETYKKGIDVYEQQINFFGQSGELEFKPFNILKKVYQNGEEIIPNDNLSFTTVNDDEILMLNFSDEKNKQANIDQAYAWFNSLTGAMEEGIMIKPRRSFIKDLPPAFKVRNDYYLTMIYGVDFMENYAHNLKRRKIEQKLSCSIDDWMINWELIKIPYRNLNPENYHLKNLLLDRIIGERNENSLDSRL